MSVAAEHTAYVAGDICAKYILLFVYLTSVSPD
jgi:hypothetical protein